MVWILEAITDMLQLLLQLQLHVPYGSGYKPTHFGPDIGGGHCLELSGKCGGKRPSCMGCSAHMLHTIYTPKLLNDQPKELFKADGGLSK